MAVPERHVSEPEKNRRAVRQRFVGRSAGESVPVRNNGSSCLAAWSKATSTER